MKFLGSTITKRGIIVYVWYDDFGYYVEREDSVRCPGGWKIVRKPYKATKEIKEKFPIKETDHDNH